MSISGIYQATDPPSATDWASVAAILVAGNSSSDPSQYAMLGSDLLTGSLDGWAGGLYDTLGDVVAGLANFIQAVGLPWVAVGDPTAYPPPEHFDNALAPIAVDISRASWSDGTTGISFSGVFAGVYTGTVKSLGYAPWDNYEDADAGLTALLALYDSGYFTFNGGD